MLQNGRGGGRAAIEFLPLQKEGGDGKSVGHAEGGPKKRFGVVLTRELEPY